LFIERDVRQALQAVTAIAEVQIVWVPAEQWNLDAITARGRDALRRIGVAIPNEDGRAHCPHCDSDAVVTDSEFGTSLCRRLAHCETCGENVELMRSRSRRHVVPAGSSLLSVLPRPQKS
jgi:ring-1,2-phenylacetyl-CoA epoxidase subunit PaaD